jgi:hypothetical protein
MSQSVGLFFTFWVTTVAIFMSIFALADNTWPKEVDKITFGKRWLVVFLYVFTIIAASITMWQTWQGVSLGGGFQQ